MNENNNSNNNNSLPSLPLIDFTVYFLLDKLLLLLSIVSPCGKPMVSETEPLKGVVARQQKHRKKEGDNYEAAAEETEAGKQEVERTNPTAAFFVDLFHVMDRIKYLQNMTVAKPIFGL